MAQTPYWRQENFVPQTSFEVNTFYRMLMHFSSLVV